MRGLGAGGVSPRHQSIDVFGEVAVREAGEEVAQVGVGLNAIHFTSADEAGKPSPIAAPFIVPGKERIAAVADATDETIVRRRLDVLLII